MRSDRAVFRRLPPAYGKNGEAEGTVDPPQVWQKEHLRWYTTTVFVDDSRPVPPRRFPSFLSL
jgi:hypothetical protein